MTRVVLVPGVPALLPEHGSLVDPVPDLRAACRAAVSWLTSEVTVLAGPADPLAARVAEHLLAGVPRGGPSGSPSLLVVGNGAACRSEKAPGHLDQRSFAFDEALGSALRRGHLDVDLALAPELLASVEGIRRLDGVLDGTPAHVDYDDDPYGVQYWVMRWQCGS